MTTVIIALVVGVVLGLAFLFYLFIRVVWDTDHDLKERRHGGRPIRRRRESQQSFDARAAAWNAAYQQLLWDTYQAEFEAGRMAPDASQKAEFDAWKARNGW